MTTRHWAARGPPGGIRAGCQRTDGALAWRRTRPYQRKAPTCKPAGVLRSRRASHPQRGAARCRHGATLGGKRTHSSAQRAQQRRRLLAAQPAHAEHHGALCDLLADSLRRCSQAVWSWECGRPRCSWASPFYCIKGRLERSESLLCLSPQKIGHDARQVRLDLSLLQAVASLAVRFAVLGGRMHFERPQYAADTWHGHPCAPSGMLPAP